jgi:hypothetical protein
MEIGPVTNVGLVSTIKSRETDLGLADVEDIEQLSRVSDETYTPSNAKSGTGSEGGDDDKYEEEDLDDDLEEDEYGEETEAKSTVPTAEGGQINFVA